MPSICQQALVASETRSLPLSPGVADLRSLCETQVLNSTGQIDHYMRLQGKASGCTDRHSYRNRAL